MTTIAERVAAGAAFLNEHGTCEAIHYFLGAEFVCGEPAIGRYARACVHEHVREGLLCREHAEAPGRGLCRACYDLPAPGSHECPITLMPAVTTERRSAS